MFENTIQLLKENKDGLLATEKGVREAKELYDQLNREITNAKRRLKRKQSPERALLMAEQIISELSKGNTLQQILMKEIDDALIRSGKEFQENVNLYKYYLYRAAEDKDIYKLIPIGSGWSIRLSPQITYESAAGNLDDYARGIRAYRSDLGVETKKGSNRGLKATNWWIKNVYGNTRYEKTIEARIGISGKIAPFWQLIAKGSTGLASDRGDGSYNPYPSRGVDFVYNAEEQIKVLFNETFTSEKTKWLEEAALFEEEINKALEYRDGFKDGVNRLTSDYKKNLAILETFGIRRQYVDEDRLAVAAEKLRAGDNIGSSRVELTRAGSPRRIYITVKRLEGLI